MLAGSVRDAKDGRRSALTMDESALGRLESYERLCADIGETPANVGLAWLLSNPVVTAPIIGPRTIEQLEAAVRATEIVLTDEILGKLDSLFPGPGDQAPEAYAW